MVADVWTLGSSSVCVYMVNGKIESPWGVCEETGICTVNQCKLLIIYNPTSWVTVSECYTTVDCFISIWHSSGIENEDTEPSLVYWEVLRKSGPYNHSELAMSSEVELSFSRRDICRVQLPETVVPYLDTDSVENKWGLHGSARVTFSMYPEQGDLEVCITYRIVQWGLNLQGLKLSGHL